MRTEQEKTNIQKITDFADKSLLIVDDDNPLRDRLARAMEKKGFNDLEMFKYLRDLRNNY